MYSNRADSSQRFKNYIGPEAISFTIETVMKDVPAENTTGECKTFGKR